MSTESSLKNWAVPWLNQQLGVAAEKRHGTATSVRGLPDVSVCLEGRHGELELKAPGKKPTRMQRHRLNVYETAGAFVGTASSRSEVRSWLERFRAVVRSKQPLIGRDSDLSRSF